MSTSGSAAASLANPVTAAQGGTGLATLTAHNVLVGEGTGTVAFAAPGASGQVLTSNGAAADPTFQAAAGGGGNAIYGDGSDGTVTFDGSSVVLGITPSANAYTLARDIFVAAMTVNNGVTIVTAGFRIFVAGTLTNNGTIKWDGNNGNAATPGGALNNVSGSISANSGAASPGTAGGAGATGVGSGGTNQTITSLGGRGGSGGAGASAGGAAGTQTANGPGNGSIRALPWAILGQLQQGVNSSTVVCVGGGTGGGGGGGDATHAGGGGGGGGGIVIVVAKTFAGTGTISAKGGNGGNAAASGTNSGGGGGGGGGVVVVISSSASGGAITGQTITAAGGTHGTHLGTGSDGLDGNAGITVVLNN